jgi:hypothetical protein
MRTNEQDSDESRNTRAGATAGGQQAGPKPKEPEPDEGVGLDEDASGGGSGGAYGELEGPELDKRVVDQIQKKASGMKVLSFAELAVRRINQEKTLLGDRFLCVAAIMLFVAPTGVGKSTALYKMISAWATGKSAFGIRPKRPLKILVIQGENDDDDMTEYVRDVVEDARKRAENGDKKDWELIHKNAKAVRINTLRGFSFILALRELLKKYRPDIVLLDPLNCYSGTDPSDAESITTFLRNWLIPTLEEFECACIICHHTPKTRDWDTTKWKQYQWVYAFAGNADIANAARAAIVVDPTDNPVVFKFVAAKRSSRIGWMDNLGQPTWIRYFKYKSVSGVIDWVDADESEIKKVKAKERARAQEKDKYPPQLLLKPLLEHEEGMTAGALLKYANNRGCPITKGSFWKKLDKWEQEGLVEVSEVTPGSRSKGDPGGRNVWSLTAAGMGIFGPSE